MSKVVKKNMFVLAFALMKFVGGVVSVDLSETELFLEPLSAASPNWLDTVNQQFKVLSHLTAVVAWELRFVIYDIYARGFVCSVPWVISSRVRRTNTLGGFHCNKFSFS